MPDPRLRQAALGQFVTMQSLHGPQGLDVRLSVIWRDVNHARRT